MNPVEMQAILDRINAAESAINRRIDDYTLTTNAQLVTINNRITTEAGKLEEKVDKVSTDFTAFASAAEAVRKEGGRPVRWRDVSIFGGGIVALDWLGHYLKGLFFP